MDEEEPKLEVCLQCRNFFGISEVRRCVTCDDYPVCQECRMCATCKQLAKERYGVA